VSPDVVDVEIPKYDGGLVRRGLMVIAKVIQSLANNIFFGKEAHMVTLNKFLENHIVNVTRFLSELSVCTFFPFPCTFFTNSILRNMSPPWARTLMSGSV
jgi:hypothetical protein